MTLKAKIALSVVVGIVVIAAVAGIAYWSAQYEEPAEEAGLYVDGELMTDPGTMMTVGDIEIGFDEYRYYYLMNEAYMEMAYGADYLKSDYDGAKALSLRKATEDTIQTMYAWQQIAEEEGITLTDEEKQEILDTLAQQKEELGEAAFAKNLQDMYFTDEAMYVRITEMQTLAKKVQTALNEQYTAENEEGADESLVTAKHILISFDGREVVEGDGSESEPDVSSLPQESAAESTAASEAADTAESASTDESAAGEAPSAQDQAAKALADQLYAQLLETQANGGDVEALFDQLIQEYGEDPGMEENPGGYTFGEGEMVQEFYDGAIALEVGEFSEPIRTDYGYHIILREPLNEEEAADKRESIIQQAASTEMNERLTAAKEALAPSYGEYYAAVAPANVQ